MRDARSDPFTPGFGNLPRVFAGRDREFDDLTTMVDRLCVGVYEQPRLVTGDRGMGKTSLLLHFEAEQREAGRWVVRAPATRDGALAARLGRGLDALLREHDLASALSAATRRLLDRLTSVSIGARQGVTVGLDTSADPSAIGDQVRQLLEAVARLARERGTTLVLLIDEAQNIDLAVLGQLFYAFQEVQGVTVDHRDPRTGALRRDALPLGVVVAGLPGLVGRLKKAGSTFGERSKPHRLEPLSQADMLVALRAFAADGQAVFDADAADAVIQSCGGYPYFLHVVGSHVWRAGTSEVVTLADAEFGIAQARPYLEEFYRQRLVEIGDLQRAYLRAAARLDASERTVGAVANELDRTSAQLGSTTNTLVNVHGLLRNDGNGRLVFALPGLDVYLRQER